MQNINFVCPKCQNTQCDLSEFRATGGILSKLFDVQTKRFTTVTCTRCTYTEMYRSPSSKLGNVFDFFTSN